jgi:hypothetical protein
MLKNNLLSISKSLLLKPLIFEPLFNKFTAGENATSLNNKINYLAEKNILSIVDYIKEYSNNPNDIKKSMSEYISLSKLDTTKYIAIKLSTFNFEYSKICPLLTLIINNNKKILIDAEDCENQDKITDLTDTLIYKLNTTDINIFKTYQLYRKDSLQQLKEDINKFDNKLGIKIVRGAYYNQDFKTGKLFSNKKDTDDSFNKAMDIIFTLPNESFICTHNKNDINKIIENVKQKKNIHHASLYGFINKDTDRIIQNGIKTFKYLPYGNMDDALPYLTRRIYENPKILFYFN